MATTGVSLAVLADAIGGDRHTPSSSAGVDHMKEWITVLKAADAAARWHVD
jgi:hypothetical protein